MTKRLRVLLHEAELREIQRIARGKRMTTAEWVRQSLRAARDSDARSDPQHKLESISAAAAHSFPIADIDELLGEIERGGKAPSPAAGDPDRLAIIHRHGVAQVMSFDAGFDDIPGIRRIGGP